MQEVGRWPHYLNWSIVYTGHIYKIRPLQQGNINMTALAAPENYAMNGY